MDLGSGRAERWSAARALRAAGIAGAKSDVSEAAIESRGRVKTRGGNQYATSPDGRFPFVLTTYRLTEHHTAGGMSRTLSHLAELQPEMFCEISMAMAQRTFDYSGRVGDDRDRRAERLRLMRW